jgi:hypothetical protein
VVDEDGSPVGADACVTASEVTEPELPAEVKGVEGA